MSKADILLVRYSFLKDEGSEMKPSPFSMPSQINTLGVGNVTLEHHGACGRENVFPFGKMVVLIHNVLSNLQVNPTTSGQW